MFSTKSFDGLFSSQRPSASVKVNTKSENNLGTSFSSQAEPNNDWPWLTQFHQARNIRTVKLQKFELINDWIIITRSMMSSFWWAAKINIINWSLPSQLIHSFRSLYRLRHFRKGETYYTFPDMQFWISLRWKVLSNH